MNVRLAIIEYIKSELLKLRKEPDPNHDIIVQRIYRSPPDPASIPDPHLPAMFYGYGGSRSNNQTIGTGYEGETFAHIINTIVNAPDPQNEDIVTRSSKLHYAIEDTIMGMQTVTWDKKNIEAAIPLIDTDILENADKDTTLVLTDGMELGFKIGDIVSPTMQYRLQSVETEAQGISDREFMVFVLEIDWFKQV